MSDNPDELGGSMGPREPLYAAEPLPVTEHTDPIERAEIIVSTFGDLKPAEQRNLRDFYRYVSAKLAAMKNKNPSFEFTTDDYHKLTGIYAQSYDVIQFRRGKWAGITLSSAVSYNVLVGLFYHDVFKNTPFTEAVHNYPITISLIGSAAFVITAGFNAAKLWSSRRIHRRQTVYGYLATSAPYDPKVARRNDRELPGALSKLQASKALALTNQ